MHSKPAPESPSVIPRFAWVSQLGAGVGGRGEHVCGAISFFAMVLSSKDKRGATIMALKNAGMALSEEEINMYRMLLMAVSISSSISPDVVAMVILRTWV